MKARLVFAGSLAVISLSFLIVTLIPFHRQKIFAEIVDVIPTQPDFKPVYGVIVRHGLRDVKAIALSFDADAGFGNRKSKEKRELLYQPKIIEILEEKNVPATIFSTGLWAENHKEVIKTLSRNHLFEIGNHSYSHPAFSKACINLPYITEDQRVEEFKKSQQTIANIIGFAPRIFRFPGGCYTKKDLALAQNYGLTIVHWDTDVRDAFGRPKEALIAVMKKQIQPGSIILLHLNGGEVDSDVAGALPEIIAYAKENGYTFVKVGDLLSQMQRATAVN